MNVIISNMALPFSVQDFNAGDLALRSSSTYAMGTAMEFCTL